MSESRRIRPSTVLSPHRPSYILSYPVIGSTLEGRQYLMNTHGLVGCGVIVQARLAAVCSVRPIPMGGCIEYIRGWDEARRRTEDGACAVVWSTPLDQTPRFSRPLDGTRTPCPISHRGSTLLCSRVAFPAIFCRPPLPPTTSAYAWPSGPASSGLVVSGRSGQPAGPGKPTILRSNSRTRSRREDADDPYLIA